jgi:hypothetical protein
LRCRLAVRSRMVLLLSWGFRPRLRRLIGAGCRRDSRFDTMRLSRDVCAHKELGFASPYEKDRANTF